ncbi:MAG: ABC transporter ATP-binding protein [Nitrososphaerota archaeon]|nr:ABC transporter ATP-binding protein [Candidatus Bathyarchaeota archaeon]MDW8048729.1 ABC transporter ATP-binding protein [Nitrososphaerota archaeon]
MPSLTMVNVTKRFGRIVAVNNLSLQVEDGEYLCVLGPTGSGKTTLLKLIAGILKPDAGEIYIGGKLVNDIPSCERNVAYVPQRYALFPHMTLLENVAFGPISRGITRKESYRIAKRLLEMMRLSGRENSFPHELSGGMQQRLALARGLATNANILLMDEPLGALDARLRVELRYKLREMVKENGLTAIHVTHDQEEAMVVGDRIAVLRHGQIQQLSSPIELYNKPRSIFVANFVGDTNFLEGFIFETHQLGSWVQMRNGLALLTYEKSFSTGEKVVLAIRDEAVEVARQTRKREELNLIPGTIQSSSFLGGFISYSILLMNGDLLRAKVPISDKRRYSIGENVIVRLRPENIIVYPYPSAGLFRELEVF